MSKWIDLKKLGYAYHHYLWSTLEFTGSQKPRSCHATICTHYPDNKQQTRHFSWRVGCDQLKSNKFTFGVGSIDILFALVLDQSFAAAIWNMEHRAEIKLKRVDIKRSFNWNFTKANEDSGSHYIEVLKSFHSFNFIFLLYQSRESGNKILSPIYIKP